MNQTNQNHIHLGFLGSMLPQYMALCVSQLVSFVKKNFNQLLSKVGGLDSVC